VPAPAIGLACVCSVESAGQIRALQSPSQKLRHRWAIGSGVPFPPDRSAWIEPCSPPKIGLVSGRGSSGPRSETTGERPGRRAAATNPAPSKVSRPRDAENRERPNSGQSPNASSKSADRPQPAKSQQTAATWRELPGSREAGSHQAQGIGPYNG